MCQPIHSVKIEPEYHANAVLQALTLAGSFASVIIGITLVNLLNAMKKLVLLLFVGLAFGACKKGDDVSPKNPVDVIAGQYKLSSFTLQQGSQKISLPSNGQSLNGVAELVKSGTEGNVELLLTVNNTKLIEAGDLEFEVKKTSEAYGLFDGTDQYADVDGSNIIFNLSGTDDNGQQIVLAFVGNR